MTIEQLQERNNKLMTDADAIARSENPGPEQRASARKMLDDVDANEEQIADLKRIASFEAKQNEQRSFERSPRPAPGAPAISVEEQKKQATAAFKDFGRYGYQSLRTEQRDLLTTSIATGGAMIPQLFLPEMWEAQKFYGPVAQKVSQKVTNSNGAPMRISLTNDTTNGIVLIGEGTAVLEADPTFSNKILGVDTVNCGLIKISFQEMDDSSFDLDMWTRGAFAKRLGRGLENGITTGLDSKGTTLPNVVSILTAATVVRTTGTVAAGIGWTDFTTTFGAIDPAYITPNATWMMNSQTRGYLIGLEDGFGRPFFTPDPSGLAPFSKILGYDITLNQSMPNMAANAIPIVFGDLAQAYMLRTDGAPSILRLNERFADQLEVGFYLYTRIGGISMSAGIPPLVAIKQAAS